MGWYTDEEILANIVAQTAEFRYRICWEGGRRLLEERGIDPLRCLLLECGQGDDVNGVLMLPDGVVVDFDMREDPKTRVLVSISNWKPFDCEDQEYVVARRIVLAADTSEFDAGVRAYFDEHWADCDAPLPPCE